MTLSVYVPSRLRVTWSGHTFVALAENGGVEITPNSDVIDNEVGMDGEVARTFLPDETANITISLQQESPSNRFMHGVMRDMRATGDIAVSDMTISDPTGSLPTTVIRDVVLMTPATYTRGKTANGSTQDWGFHAAKLPYDAVAPLNNFAATVAADVQVDIDAISLFLQT